MILLLHGGNSLKQSNVIKFDYWLISITAAFTLVMAIYAAQPWGDNYAYQKASDYLALFCFMLWDIAPYIIIAFLLRYFCRSETVTKIFTAGILIISLVTALILIDTNFVHIDAQGGLIFLFLPFYQGIAVFILLAICSIVKRIIKRTT